MWSKCTSACTKIFILWFIINGFHFPLLSIFAVKFNFSPHQNFVLMKLQFVFHWYINFIFHCLWLSHKLFSLFTELSLVLLQCIYCVSVGYVTCEREPKDRCVAMTVFWHAVQTCERWTGLVVLLTCNRNKALLKSHTCRKN
jgi:hypothetical protein